MESEGKNYPSQKGEKDMWEDSTIARLSEMFEQLGIFDGKTTEIALKNWEEELRTLGAKSWNEQERLYASELKELQALTLILVEARVCVICTSEEDGEEYILVEETNEEEITALGRTSELWTYKPEGADKENVVLEHPVVTICRKLQGELGIRAPMAMTYLTANTVTRKCENGKNAYNLCIYYCADENWEYMKNVMHSPAYDEGKMKQVRIRDLPKYKISSDALEAFSGIYMDIFEMPWPEQTT